MTDYKNGKIYVLKSNETKDVYIGSTCSTLKDRLCKHKSAFKTGKIRIGTSKNILKYADAYIELIENFPCETKRKLLNREGEITKNTLNCVNKLIQGRTATEYRIDNADKLKQQSTDYRKNNKEKINKSYKDWYSSEKGKAYYEKRKAKINVKVVCPICNIEISKSNLTRHQKSKNCK